MLLGSFILGLDYKNAYKIYKRDKNKSSSPNSCKTESVAAGALDVELLGDAYYFGKLVKKETIGDNIKEIEIDDIAFYNYAIIKACLKLYKIKKLGKNRR